MTSYTLRTLFAASVLVAVVAATTWSAEPPNAPIPNELQAAKARLEAALKMNPQNEDALYEMAATTFWTAADLESAEPYYTRLLKLNPKHYAARYDFARLLQVRGRYAQSLEEYRQFLKVAPDPSEQLAYAKEMVAEYEPLAVPRAGGADKATWTVKENRATNSIGMTFIRIPGGDFVMGYAKGKAQLKPEHKVELDPYWMGEYEVTAGQFKTFLQETKYRPRSNLTANPVNDYARAEDYPAVFMTWDDAVAFTVWLSFRDGAIYRLPSEAEWELAARGFDGRTNPWGNSEAKPGAHGNLGRGARAVSMGKMPTLEKGGSYPEGKSFFGLYDMAGNADEWCLDWYDPAFYAKSPKRDPFGPVWGKDLGRRVLRGAGWRLPPLATHAVERNSFDPSAPYDSFGFRVVREIHDEARRD